MNIIQDKIETETKYPLIKKYIISDKNVDDFFTHFTIEQLDHFENSLHLYFNTQDIKYNQEYGSLESTEDYDFNRGVIRLACGLITYQDFIDDYGIDKSNYSEVILSKVIDYFREHKIKNLMEYGNDYDEGLYHLSSLYKELMDKLNIKYMYVSTEDISDGKYLTTITFEDNSEIKLDTDAFNGIKVVSQNVDSIYEHINRKSKGNEKENDIECEY